MQVDYELDQWEWQGVTRAIDIDPEDYRGMSEDEIKQAVYDEIRRDAEQNLHLVYEETETVQDIMAALRESDDEEDTEEESAQAVQEEKATV